MFALRHIDGCAMFFQPERIDPPDPMNPDYDVRADVWSLGITLVSYNSVSFPVGIYLNSSCVWCTPIFTENCYML